MTAGTTGKKLIRLRYRKNCMLSSYSELHIYCLICFEKFYGHYANCFWMTRQTVTDNNVWEG